MKSSSIVNIFTWCMFCTAHGDYTTTIVPGQSYGLWEGWGTSLAWWAKAFGDREDVADAIFTMQSATIGHETVPGLGINIVRYNQGASSEVPAHGEVMETSPNASPTRLIDAFWLDWSDDNAEGGGTWDWSRDAGQRSMLQKARDRGADIFQLFSNSPVWWQCLNHNPSGSDSGSSDNLQWWNYGQHAAGLVEILAHAREYWNVTFSSVEAFNEPMSSWWTSTGTQEGCHFDVSTQRAVLGELRSELDGRGFAEVEIAASDETSYTLALSTWEALAEEQEKVDLVTVHGYEYGGGRRDLLYDAVQAAGKKLWNSEYGEGDASGMSLASNLNLDMRWLHPTAWVYWQASLQIAWLHWVRVSSCLCFVGWTERKQEVTIMSPSLCKPTGRYSTAAAGD